MSNQLTQCPHCLTSFRVTEAQLNAADSLVRCGSCLGLFSASINFIRVKPAFDPDAETEDEGDDPDNFDDDEISLGNLDLDAEPDSMLAEDEDDTDNGPEFRSALEDDMAAALREAEDILAEPRERPRPAEVRLYQTYEEYEEIPDLFGQPVPAATRSAGHLATDDDTWNQDTDPDAQPADEYELLTTEWDENGATAGEDAPEEEDELEEEFNPLGHPDLEADELGYEYTELVLEHEEEDEFSRLLELEALQAEQALDAELLDEDEELLADEELLVEALLDEERADEEAGDAAPDAEDMDEKYLDAELLDELDPFEPWLSNAAALRAYDEDEADAEEIFDEYSAEVGMRAIADDDSAPAPAAKPAWLREPKQPDTDKSALRGYLSALEDEEALQPLGATHLEYLEEEPLTLAAGRNQRGVFAVFLLTLLSLLLLTTLVLQFVDQHLDQLSQRNSFARFLPLVCRVLDCPPPAVTSTLSSLYSQELLVRTHPRVDNALELSFIFRNDADLPQPFPGLELSFRNVDDQLLANRLFRPEEYLPAELRPLEAMPPRSSVQVMLELADPGANAVNYTIAFREL